MRNKTAVYAKPSRRLLGIITTLLTISVILSSGSILRWALQKTWIHQCIPATHLSSISWRVIELPFEGLNPLKQKFILGFYVPKTSSPTTSHFLHPNVSSAQPTWPPVLVVAPRATTGVKPLIPPQMCRWPLHPSSIGELPPGWWLVVEPPTWKICSSKWVHLPPMGPSFVKRTHI